MSFRLEALDLSKRFGNQSLFSGISLELTVPDSLVILGPNGSGKSTLIQLLAGYISPDQGSLKYYVKNAPVTPDEHYAFLALAAPYLDIPEELTAGELMDFHFSLRPSVHITIQEMLERIGLKTAKDKQIRYFSSGMKQRLKLGMAVFSDTPLLFLDEPCSNLDAEGILMYKDLIKDFTQDRLVVVASNMPDEYSFCKKQITLVVH